MKVVILNKNVESALEKISKAVKNSVTMSIDCESKQTSFTAYDGAALQVVSFFNVESVEAGDEKKLVFRFGKEFVEVVSKMLCFGEKLTMEVTEKQVVLTCGKAKTALEIKVDGSASDLQVSTKTSCTAKIGSAHFKKGVMRAGYATGVNELYSSVAFRFDIKEDGSCETVSICSSDAVRAAGTKLKLNGFNGSDTRIIAVPDKALKKSLSVITSDEVELFFSKDQLTIKSGADLITLKLVNGNYPNFFQILNGPRGDVKLSVDKDEYVNALSLISALSSERGVETSLVNGGVVLQSFDGKGKIELQKVKSLEGEFFPSRLDIRFLLDAVSTIEGDELLFQMTNKEYSNVFLVAEGFVNVLLPIK